MEKLNFGIKFLLVWTILFLIGLFISYLFGSLYTLFSDFYNSVNFIFDPLTNG